MTSGTAITQRHSLGICATAWLLAALGCVLMAGCAGQPTPALTTATDAQAASVAIAGPAQEAAPAQGRAVTVAPEPLIVSTNEPFWQARVEGALVVLNGADAAERKLQIETFEVAGDTRTVRATDAQGWIEVRVVDTPCQDDMSGAAWPMSGTLTINGQGPHRGCARPAGMAPPRPTARMRRPA